VKREPYQAKAILKAAFHARREQVEGEDRHGKNPKQGKPAIEPEEVLVQERGHGGLHQHVHDHVYNPYDNDDGRRKTHHEPHEGHERVEPGHKTGGERSLDGGNIIGASTVHSLLITN